MPLAAHEPARDRRSRVYLAGVLLFVLGLSLAPRIAQWSAWQAQPDRYFSEGVPVASSDSYHWFRYAEAYAQGGFPVGRDALRMYPTGAEVGDVPALSLAMAWTSRLLATDVHRAGQLLCALLSSLFVLPLGVYLARAGAPWAIVPAAVVGSFGTGYFERTTLVFVDTEGGNLFFFWLVALGILEMTRARWPGLLAAAGAGLGVLSFVRWYEQPGLVPVFAAAALAHLVLARMPRRHAALRFGLFVLCAAPLAWQESLGSIWDFVDRYLWSRALDPAALAGPVAFPSLLPEIAELRTVGAVRALELASGSALLGALGLAGFAVFAGQRPRALAPLAPMLALCVLGFTSGRRFLMYAGPFVGIGIGTLFRWGLDAVIARSGGARSPIAGQGAAYAATLALGLALLPLTSFFQPAEARIQVQDLRALQALRAELAPDAAVLHVWGRGYLVTALTGAATFNDGQDPDPVVEQLIDRGLTDPDPRVLYDTAAFLATHGRARIDAIARETGSYAGLLERIQGTPLPDDVRLYVLFTRQMLDGYPLLDRKGRYDPDAPAPRAPQGYDRRRCASLEGSLRCSKDGRRDLLLDPERGLVGGRARVSRLVTVRDGRVVAERDEGSGMWLQLVSTPWGDTELHVLKPFVFASNLNQMLVLGRHDETLFREVPNGSLVARAYELLPSP
jgi:asparagine N-glycosylation enzyme membrane subunit Stt3